MLTMRCDMRVPDWAEPAAAHYSTAATEFVRAGKSLPLHPFHGGIEPDVALRYLQTAVAAHQQAQMVHG